jgi:hypothetical protein
VALDRSAPRLVHLCQTPAVTPSEIAARLPAPADLERFSIAIAALDAVLCPDWELRYFSYDPAWGDGERMASMDNGSGDTYQVVFGPTGTVLRAFDHESPLSPWTAEDGSLAPGILDGLPDSLRSVIDEPAFGTEDGPEVELTFCAWNTGTGWSVGSIDDDGGAEYLLALVYDGTAAGYREYAVEYFEEDPGLEAIRTFIEHRPVTLDDLVAINPDADGEVLDELRILGYPAAPPSG